MKGRCLKYMCIVCKDIFTNLLVIRMGPRLIEVVLGNFKISRFRFCKSALVKRLKVTYRTSAIVRHLRALELCQISLSKSTDYFCILGCLEY